MTEVERVFGKCWSHLGVLTAQEGAVVGKLQSGVPLSTLQGTPHRQDGDLK